MFPYTGYTRLCTKKILFLSHSSIISKPKQLLRLHPVVQRHHAFGYKCKKQQHCIDDSANVSRSHRKDCSKNEDNRERAPLRCTSLLRRLNARRMILIFPKGTFRSHWFRGWGRKRGQTSRSKREPTGEQSRRCSRSSLSTRTTSNAAGLNVFIWPTSNLLVRRRRETERVDYRSQHLAAFLLPAGPLSLFSRVPVKSDRFVDHRHLGVARVPPLYAPDFSRLESSTPCCSSW